MFDCLLEVVFSFGNLSHQVDKPSITLRCFSEYNRNDDGSDDDDGSEGYSCNPPKVRLRLHTKWLLWKSLSDGLSQSPKIID